MAFQLFFQSVLLLVWQFIATNAAQLKQQECPPQNSQISAFLLGSVVGAIGMFVWMSKQQSSEPVSVRSNTLSVRSNDGISTRTAVSGGVSAPSIQVSVSSTQTTTPTASLRTPQVKSYASREVLWPFNCDDFRKHMKTMVEFIIDYVHAPHKYSVFTDKKFGFVYDNFPKTMPVQGEKFEDIMDNVSKIIMPGMLHWQHPRFHGYFGAGLSYPDILADSLISGLGVVPYAWIGAPSLVELEMVVINWFGKALGLEPDLYFSENAKESKGGGIITYSSSEIIYESVMVSRYRKLREYVQINDPDRRIKEGELLSKMIAYTNAEAHSAIEKACNMALVRLRPVKPVTDDFGLTGKVLEKHIKADIAAGLIPFHVHGSLGTTGSAAIDRLDELQKVAEKYKCWFHVDAAYGGCAMLCPEFRPLGKGLEKVDSLNINIYKWPFCSMPLSFFWCRHGNAVENTFSVYPVYLRASNDDLPAFRHWGIQLSRRALCLKAWFIMRIYGLEGMQKQIRQLARNADAMCELIRKDERFVIVGKPAFTLFTFRINADTMVESSRMTKEFCEFINRSRQMFVTHAKPSGIDVIRINMSHPLSNEDDARESYRIISELMDEYMEKMVDFSSLRYQADAVTEIKGSPMILPKSPTPSSGAEDGPKSDKETNSNK